MSEPDPSLSAILTDARSVWGDRRMTLPEIAVASGVVHGDLCRAVRDHTEGEPADEATLRRELGNMIVSAVRWADDLGLDVGRCVQESLAAQRAYIARRAA